MQPKQNTLIPVEKDIKEEYWQVKLGQDLEKDPRDFKGENLDKKSVKDKLFRHIRRNNLFANKSISSLKEVMFSKKDFSTSKPILILNIITW